MFTIIMAESTRTSREELLLTKESRFFLVIRVLITVNAKGRHTRHSCNKCAQRVSGSQLQVAALAQECV